MTRKIVVASNNPGKLREFGEMFAPLGIVLHGQSEFGVSEADEPHMTFLENALTKARHASRMTGLPAMADDSGVCVDALGGAPGVVSAFYAGLPKSDIRNNEKLIADLNPFADKSASYYCILVYLRHADDPQPIIAEGRWRGEIIAKPIGENGFGYDPYFLIPELGKTAAELSPHQKNVLSHRGQALRQLFERLR